MHTEERFCTWFSLYAVLDLNTHLSSCYHYSTLTRGPFLDGHSRISNLMITKLFNSHILNMKRRSLHTRSFWCIHISLFGYRLIKNGLAGRKVSEAFKKRAPGIKAYRCKFLPPVSDCNSAPVS